MVRERAAPVCGGGGGAASSPLRRGRRVCCAHLPRFVSFIRHSFTWRSSAPETISGSVVWKLAQLTPRSWPSSTYFTVASFPPNRSSTFTFGSALPSFDAIAAPADPAAVGAGSGARSIASRSSGVTEFGRVFLRSPAMSQTRTVWSREAERTRSSFGWNCAHIT